MRRPSQDPPGRIRLLAAVLVCGLVATAGAAGGAGSIKAQDLREWLTYIASDELQGRAIYSTGLGLAAAYLQEHLRQWGVKPAGDHGSYLQTVRVLGVQATSHSTLTVEVGGESRTFVDGQDLTLPKNVGGKRRFTINRVEFAGYGLDIPSAGHVDYGGRDLTGAAVVWLGSAGPRELDRDTYRRELNGRSQYALAQLRAAASLSPEPENREPAPAPAAPGPAAPGRGGRGGGIPNADFTTAQRLDRVIAPDVGVSEALMEFLFSAAPETYQDLRRKALDREPLPTFRLDGVTLIFNLDADYKVVRTQFTQNVVAVVEGSDARLKNTYVAFSAHYDHIGYAQGEAVDGRRPAAPGRISAGTVDDRIWNGADDDGSGTVAVMAIARAFAAGPRPKRSVLLIWHSGEESGLFGSRYFADNPTVPLDQVVADLNIDMVGRNRDNKPSESNTVYPVGSDRISTELHNINAAANAALPHPFTLDYALNDPTDPEQLYFRSDHYSYAAKGIPVIFFTTGLHPDYHANTDEVSRIDFDKLTRVTQLVFETGSRVANLDHAPVRDNRGARTGSPAGAK